MHYTIYRPFHNARSAAPDPGKRADREWLMVYGFRHRQTRLRREWSMADTTQTKHA